MPRETTPFEFGMAISGKSDGTPLIFIHGWPDDGSLWADLIGAFEMSFKCVALTLPNFGGQPGPAEGCSFTDLIGGLARAVAKVSRGGKVILIGHDWGAHLAYLYEKNFSHRVKAMVTIDVGPRIGPDSVDHALFLVSYQWWLIGAWSVGRIYPSAGDAMSRWLAAFFGAPKPTQVRSKMNYPYLYFWRDFMKGENKFETLIDYSPKVPLLFLFGGSKPYMFHTEQWLEDIRRKRLSKSIEFKSCGHWLMLEQPDVTAHCINNWLATIVNSREIRAYAHNNGAGQTM